MSYREPMSYRYQYGEKRQYRPATGFVLSYVHDRARARASGLSFKIRIPIKALPTTTLPTYWEPANNNPPASMVILHIIVSRYPPSHWLWWRRSMGGKRTKRPAMQASDDQTCLHVCRADHGIRSLQMSQEPYFYDVASLGILHIYVYRNWLRLSTVSRCLSIEADEPSLKPVGISKDLKW